MVWTIIVVLVALWLIGMLANIGGGLLNILLVVALIFFVYNLFAGRDNV